MDTSFLTFLSISALVIASPGPDTALTVRNALLGGRRAGTFTALGVSVGQVVWAIGTSVGLVALLVASEPVFQALKLLGAAYLLYLGIQSLRSAFRHSPRPSSVPAASGRAKLGGSRAFRPGVINDLANPKMAVFFASVLPRRSLPELAHWCEGLVCGALLTVPPGSLSSGWGSRSPWKSARLVDLGLRQTTSR